MRYISQVKKYALKSHYISDIYNTELRSNEASTPLYVLLLPPDAHPMTKLKTYNTCVKVNTMRTDEVYNTWKSVKSMSIQSHITR